MDAASISLLLSPHAEEICRQLLPGGNRKGNTWYAGSVGGEKGSSLQVFLDGPRQGYWKDWAIHEHRGDLIDLIRFCRGISVSEAIQAARSHLNLPNDYVAAPPRPKPLPNPAPARLPSPSWLKIQETMFPGTVAQLQALASLRKLPSTIGLQLASRHGQLHFGPVYDDGHDHAAWILTDGSRKNAQARRMDGQLWTFGPDRKPAKSKTIPGCAASWPVGLSEAPQGDLALVEGAPDFLAAWQLISETGRVGEIWPIVMFGAANPIPEEALPSFRGRQVWLFPHADQAGAVAARNWCAQLAQVNATCESIDLSLDRCKDVNEVVSKGAV